MSELRVLPTGLPVGTTAAPRITAEHRAAVASFRRRVEADLLAGSSAYGAFEPVAASVPTSAGVTYIVVLVLDTTGEESEARRVLLETRPGPNATVVARYVAPTDPSITQLAKALETAIANAASELARDPSTAATIDKARETASALAAAQAAFGAVKAQGDKSQAYKDAYAVLSAATVAQKIASDALRAVSTKPAVTALGKKVSAESQLATAFKLRFTPPVPPTGATVATLPAFFDAYFACLAMESTLRATYDALVAAAPVVLINKALVAGTPFEAVANKLRGVALARADADAGERVQQAFAESDWATLGLLVQDTRAAQFIDAPAVDLFDENIDAWVTSDPSKTAARAAVRATIAQKLEPIRLVNGLIGEGGRIAVAYLNDGNWAGAKATLSAKGSPHAIIVETAVAQARVHDHMIWSADAKAVLTMLRDTIDDWTLAPLLQRATTVEGANATVETLAEWMGVLSMLSPTTIELRVVEPVPPSQLPGAWAVREILVRVPSSELEDDATLFAAASTVFAALRNINIAPPTTLPTGRRVQLGGVVVHELLKIAKAVMTDATWGEANDKAAWLDETVGPARLLLFAPVIAASGAYGPNVAGSVWSGAFSVSKMPFGARVVITVPQFTIVITIGQVHTNEPLA
jgi:hypothetical protein